MPSSGQFRDLTPATAGIVGMCSSLFILQFLMRLEVHHVTLCPRLVVYLHEYYRLISSSLFHGGLMHVGINMMSTLAIGVVLERRLGTMLLLLSTLWAVVLTSLLYTVIALLLSAVFSYDGPMYQHSIGFSGVIFHLVVMECALITGSGSGRSVFGLFRVPSYLYPWVLLFTLQFIMPNLSFLGHLSGILTGTMQLYGAFDGFAIVGEAYLKQMEQWPSCRWLVSLPTFVPTPDLSEAGLVRRESMLIAIRNVLGSFVLLVGNILDTVRVIVFGRGQRLNANISMSPLRAMHSDEEDDPNMLLSDSNSREVEHTLV